MSGVTLHDLADDVAAVIRDLGAGRAVLLGPPSDRHCSGWWRLIILTWSPR